MKKHRFLVFTNEVLGIYTHVNIKCIMKNKLYFAPHFNTRLFLFYPLKSDQPRGLVVRTSDY
jgi:hypothetical protein